MFAHRSFLILATLLCDGPVYVTAEPQRKPGFSKTFFGDFSERWGKGQHKEQFLEFVSEVQGNFKASGETIERRVQAMIESLEKETKDPKEKGGKEKLLLLGATWNLD